ncbi:hypothetical protein NP493_1041g00014 [Ridgeia piscesae]|uniref:Tyrosine-protein kinase ephrin type A/B receptor-like domain-containing protein n=1 Tax=Ridgeia piscesae TaxID=27915 RepID=A0AAD9KHU9_RIDPI|nr:hypothetical protein NP493_1041g00014 [Ridgeia piscesae]
MKWGVSDQDTYSGFCSSDGCNELDVKVKCSPSGKRKRREVEQGIAYITVDDLSTTLRSSNGQVLSPEDIVMAGVLDNPSGLDFSAATYPSIALRGRTTIGAYVNRVQLVSIKTKPCAQRVNLVATALQPKLPALSANSCAMHNLITETLSEKCRVGAWYDHTTSRCQPCAKGFYQDEEAQFICKPCPVTKTTDSTGSTSQAQCKDGMDAGEGGSCHDCPRGTYRRRGLEEKCVPCLKGWTTLREKSVSESDCTVRKYDTCHFHIDRVYYIVGIDVYV